MKHESTISFRSQIGSQLNGQQLVKATKDANISKQGFGLCILGCPRYFVHYLEKRRTINNKYYIALLVCLKEEINKKRPQMKKYVLFYQDNAPCHKLIAMMSKLHDLHFELLLHPPYSPDLAPSNYWLFADLKRMLQGNRFGSNEEMISEKGHWIVREALESVYHPRWRLSWWIKFNFA